MLRPGPAFSESLPACPAASASSSLGNASAADSLASPGPLQRRKPLARTPAASSQTRPLLQHHPRHSPFPSYLLSPLSLNFLRVFRTLAHDRAYWVRGPGGPYPDLYLPLTFSFSNSRPRLPSPGPPGPIILLHSRALSIAALSPAPMGE